MPMPAVLKKILSWIGLADEDDGSRSGLAKLFSNDRQHPGIPLARQGEIPEAVKLDQGGDGTCRTGSIAIDGGSLAWREFVWGEHTQGSRCWHSVRWRFYENGHVCFDGLMSNSSHGVHPGHMQGHRIELREKNGLLLGVWATGFFVRRGQAKLGFQADLLDDHATLKMHFAELGEKQSGFWLYR